MGRNGVETRPSSIRITFTFEGKQHRKTLTVNGAAIAPTPANLNYAERLAAEIRDRIRLGAFSMAEYFPDSGPQAGELTVARQMRDWIAAQRIEESTRSGYMSAIRFWQGAAVDGRPLGDMPLRALRTSHILKALATRPTLTGKGVNNYVSVLRESVELAVTDKVLTENPVNKVKRASHQKEPPDPFSHAEAQRIIDALHERHPAQVANLVEFWFWTGMRTSEIFGLAWPNVDLASGKALVTDVLVRGRAKANTKTNATRLVALNSRALAAIERQREHTHLAGEKVFQDPRYSADWNEERAFRRSFWTPVLKLLGIRYRRPYNMRHTYATAMLMAGMNPAFCARQLGHSVEVFHRTYARWLDGEQNDQEMARLEKALEGGLSPNKPKEVVSGLKLVKNQ